MTRASSASGRSSPPCPRPREPSVPTRCPSSCIFLPSHSGISHSHTIERERYLGLMSVRQRRLSPEFSAIPTPVFAWERRGDDLVLVDWNAAAEEQTRGHVVTRAGESASTVYATQPSILRRLRETRPGDGP